MPRDMFGDVVDPSIKVGGQKWYTVPLSILVHTVLILAADSQDLTAALVAGTGAGSPYAAGAVTARRGALGLKALYAWNPDRFRRADVPGPTQTESEKENISLTYDLGSAFQVGVARQHFLQDSADAAPPIRAVGNSTSPAGGSTRSG